MFVINPNRPRNKIRVQNGLLYGNGKTFMLFSVNKPIRARQRLAGTNIYLNK